MKTSRTPLLLLGVAFVVALAFAPLKTGSASATNTAYYVDCSAASNGSGTQLSPWNAISTVNAKAGGFGAGDQILFNRGTTCSGALSPSGSGSSSARITIDAYGTGASPIIAGGSNQYAIKLSDQSYWTITNLKLTGGTRYGLFVTVTTGTVYGITASNLEVSGVTGGALDSKDTGLVVVAPTHDATNTTSARFDGVLIHNVLAHDTTLWAGILVGTGSNTDSWATTQSKRSANITIEDSVVYNTYGEGIVIWTANQGTIQRNVAHNTGQQATQTIGTPNAIWTYACNGCLVQFNEVYNAHSPGVDGGAFDVDYFSDNTTVQYNYAHDNSAYCVSTFGAENYVTSNTTIRYNVCANNGNQAVSQRNDITVGTWNGGTVNGLLIYNNTFVTNFGVLSSGSQNFSGTMPVAFRNNIVRSSVSNPVGPTSGFSFDHNLWFTTAGSFSNGEPNAVFADPQLVDAAHTGNGFPSTAYQLQSTSPAIDAGAIISSPGTQDFYGNSIPRGAATDIGAAESPYGGGLVLGNAGFESGALNGGWNCSPSGCSVGGAAARTGSYGASVVDSSRGIFQTISGLSPNTTYRLEGWIKSAAAGQSAYLYVKSYGGSQINAPTSSLTTYARSSILFTTGITSTTAEIGVWRDAGSGTGTVFADDFAVAAAPNLLTNSGFEAGALTGWSCSPSGCDVSTTSPHTGSYSAIINDSSRGLYRVLTGLTPNTTYVYSAWTRAGSSGQSGYIYVKNQGSAQINSTTSSSLTWVQSTITFVTGASSTSAEIGVWRDAGSGTGALFYDDATLILQ